MNNSLVPLESMFRDCMLIRRVEEQIIEMYPSNLIQSPVHLSIGQEAVAVGLCHALDKADLVFPTYRGHSFYIAKGGDLRSFFSELMGRVAGVSGGKAGSMHLAAPEKGLMGASAIVATTISHAVGAALGERVKNKAASNKVFVTVFGDGATEQGAFFETLNFATLYSVPVLFICEDNGLAVHSEINERRSFNLEKLVKSFDIAYDSVDDGYSVESVYKSAKGAIERIRAGKGPVFLNIKTKRYMEHVGPGEDFQAGYRSASEVEEWKSKDPLSDPDLLPQEEIDAIDREIEDAIEFAKNSEYPGLEELFKDVI